MQETLMFKNDKCLLCGHLEGDHEGPYDGKWYCDDDYCEDRDSCSIGEL